VSLAIRKVKAYLRLIIVVVVAGAVGLILFENRSNRVTVWFFGLTDPAQPVNVVWLLLFTALATIAAWRALTFTRGLWKDLRELKRLDEVGEVERRQRQRAAELEARERQLTQQLKQSPGHDGGLET
jgi:hypothetical protein